MTNPRKELIQNKLPGTAMLCRRRIGAERTEPPLLQSDYLVRRDGKVYLILRKISHASLRTAMTSPQSRRPGGLLPGLLTQITALAGSDESLFMGAKSCLLQGCSLLRFGQKKLEVHVR